MQKNFASATVGLWARRANNPTGEVAVNDSPVDCQSHRTDRSIFSAEKIQDRWLLSFLLRSYTGNDSIYFWRIVNYNKNRLRSIEKLFQVKGGSYTVNVLSRKRCVIGEGPIWNEFDNKLYQVNVHDAEKIFCIDLDSGENTVRKLDFPVAAIAFSKKGDMLISCLDGIYILNDDNTRTPLYNIEKYEIKYGNDAKIGPDGRFYIGTQSSKRMGAGDEIDGKLYRIDKNGEVKVLLDGLILSNGLDWSIDEKRFYHADSGTRMIKEYNFDKENGEISFTGRQVNVLGVDGFTIDQNDLLYVACWGKGYIAVVDTDDMQIKSYIDVPAKIPASCCFAGENLDKFVVTTASYGADLKTDIHAGYTFICETKTKGRKPYLFG